MELQFEVIPTGSSEPPEVLQAIMEGQRDVDSGLVTTFEELEGLLKIWTSRSSSRTGPSET